MASLANESFANTLLVEVEGSALPADVASLLTYAYVDDSRNLPDMFVLRFRDPQHLVLSKARFTIGAKVSLRVKTAEPGAPQALISGEVTAIELDLDRSGSVTEVRGLDEAHRLFRGRRVTAFPNMTVADVVRKVTERAGLKVGRIDSVPGVGGQQNTQLSQDDVSDWEFLIRLADLVGAQVMVADGKLDFRLPEAPSGAPAKTAAATTDRFVLEANRNLTALRACLTAAEQVPEVEVRAWDFEHKQEMTATATPRSAGTEVDGVDPVAMAKKFASPAYLAAGPGYHSQGEVKAAANALADRLGGACAELEGIAKGNPKLRAGVAVALTGVGEPFAGKYTLTTTRHLFSEQAGYTTAFTVSSTQERSLYGLAAGPRPGGGGQATAGLVPAVVSDVRDPLDLGRVRVVFPWLSKDFTSGWARTVQAGAGKGRGAVILPEVGDEVLVGFAGGDLDSAYVLGGLYNGKDTMPSLSSPVIDANSGEIGVRGFVSRTGHRVEFVDSPRTDGVVLATGDGKFKLSLDKKGQMVELSSGGTVKISGMGITVDAGTGVLELKGQQVKVTGQSAAELTASGTVTVRGGMVRIN
ncbi:MAG TPA: VgrG-related protein [Pilimelia sp.]|nr:VgrG-related protein [Pilimelia sp.]